MAVKLRAVVVGCGRMGARPASEVAGVFPVGWLPLSHVEAITASPDYQLVGVADTDLARAQSTAARFPVIPAFADYRELIRETRPDVVSIATRTEGRCELIRFAVDNGVRGIHTEKPLGRSLVECDLALDAVKKNGVKLSYGPTRRYMDVYRRAKALVRSGVIGDLQQITVEFGRANLLWSHPHSVDLMLFFSGAAEISELQASCLITPDQVTARLVDADPIVENAFVRFANGVNGAITCASGINVRLAGTDGNLAVLADGSSIEWQAKKQKDAAYQLDRFSEVPTPARSGTETAFAELARSVCSSSPPPIEADEIRLSMQVLFGFVQSSLEGGRRVALDEIHQDLTVTGKQGAFYA